MMTAKEYLNQISVLRCRCEILERKCAELRTEAEGVKAITYDRDKVQTTADNRLERTMLRLVDLESKYVRAIAEYHAAIHTREKQIAALDKPMYAELLSLRYINGYSLQQVADELHERHPDREYNEGYIRKAHGWALYEFQKKYKSYLTGRKKAKTNFKKGT